MLALPTDHRVEDAQGFAAAIRVAHAASEGGAVVTFGVVPPRAETGYGHIELAAAGREGVQPVWTFVEKPDAERARTFAASGRHLWNSGMFLVDAEVTLTEIGAHSPEMAAAVAESVERGSSDLDFFRPHEAFLRSPSASFDVAVMERTTRAAVLPVDFGWSDIGSREAVLEAGGVDGRGNCFVGDVLPLDVGRTLVHSSHRLVGAVGVDRLVIVETAEAVLVAGRSRVQDVGALVARLRGSGCSEHSLHTEMHRPWSSYEGVGRGERHQVKRIKAKPGASLSLQMRRHRAELWVVVRGVAEVTRGGETFALRENQSAYIPRGVKHRLRNAADGTLELIKVQVGDYLGEDDIVRFEDQYGRVPR